jgi:hypothetical protein
MERFDLVICLLPWVFMKHAVLIESYSRSQGTMLLSFGSVILFAHFHLLNEQKRCKIAQDHKKQIGMNYQSNLRSKQLLKSLSLLFCTEREIARNELLDLESLGTNQEEQIFGFHRNLARGYGRFSKFIENSIKIALLDECKRDLGINLRIARRIQ